MARQAHQKDYLKVSTTSSALKRIEILNSTSYSPTDNDKRPDSDSLECKENDLDNKHRDSIDIKQERFNDALCPEDDFMTTAQPPLKKLRADVADAESNTTNSGELKLFVTIYLLRAMKKGKKG
jgi:hypothetical protein